MKRKSSYVAEAARSRKRNQAHQRKKKILHPHRSSLKMGSLPVKGRIFPFIPKTAMSRGQRLMSEMILLFLRDGIAYVENARPLWLYGMELDLFFPNDRVAFEFQGDQHFIKTDMKNDLEKQKWRDARKMILAKKRSVRLVRIEAWELSTENMQKIVRREFPQSSQALQASDLTHIDSMAISYRAYLLRRYPESITALRSDSRDRIIKQREGLEKKLRAKAPCYIRPSLKSETMRKWLGEKDSS